MLSAAHHCYRLRQSWWFLLWPWYYIQTFRNAHKRKSTLWLVEIGCQRSRTERHYPTLKQYCGRLSDGSPLRPLVIFPVKWSGLHWIWSHRRTTCCLEWWRIWWLFYSKRSAIFVLSTQKSFIISYNRRNYRVQHLVRWALPSFRNTDLIVGALHGMKNGTPTHLVLYQRGSLTLMVHWQVMTPHNTFLVLAGVYVQVRWVCLNLQKIRW
jgi:hypothetical protein